MLQLFDVGGMLVRRWVPMQRRLALESWNGDGWEVYSDVDKVVRYGQLLTETRAIELLQEIRSRRSAELAPFTPDEARAALSDRQRRA